MITFVGAGPGAEDLITVRGQNLLKRGRHRDLCRIACQSGTSVNVQRELRDL